MFLPRLEEKELPSKQARTPDEIAEERRLLYVGMTRAKRVLVAHLVGQAESRFLAELGVARRRRRRAGRASADWTPDGAAAARVAARARAGRRGAAVRRLPRQRRCTRSPRARPASLGELAQIAGVGPAKLERYGDDVLAVVGRD